MTNSSASDKFGGASQAAAFIEAFVEKTTSWVHLDIAGPSMEGNSGTGFGTQTILNYILNENKKNNIKSINEVPNLNLSLQSIKNPVLNYI